MSWLERHYGFFIPVSVIAVIAAVFLFLLWVVPKTPLVRSEVRDCQQVVRQRYYKKELADTWEENREAFRTLWFRCRWDKSYRGYE